ncbi:MAG: hypothetical protein GXO85_04315 [Chlorobi bacterium]|nr:hypothetical protein [Chlorobiota bacterium]
MFLKRHKIKNGPKVLFPLILCLVFLISCDGFGDDQDGNYEDVDCNNLHVGLLTSNTDIVKTEVNKLLVDLYPIKTDEDKFGQKNNLDILIKKLNKQCNNLSAELICYACIKTNPPQSEILIKTDSLGIPIERIIDISTPDNAVLQCVSVH